MPIKLSPAELRVQELLAMGKVNKIIARELDISEGTVKSHVSSILEKLKVPNRVGATLAYLVALPDDPARHAFLARAMGALT